MNRRDVQVFNNRIVAHDSAYLYYYDPKTLTETRVLPDINLSGAIKVQQALSKIFVLQKEGLTVYRTK
jgi:hypothetical protein